VLLTSVTDQNMKSIRHRLPAIKPHHRAPYIDLVSLSMLTQALS